MQHISFFYVANGMVGFQRRSLDQQHGESQHAFGQTIVDGFIWS